MKLYYSPGACSLSPHIVAREAGIAIDLKKVDLKAKKLASGGDFIAGQSEGLCPDARDRRRPAPDRGPGDRAVPRRPEAGIRPRAQSGDDGALPPAGVAQLHHFRTAQDLGRVVQPEDRRRLETGDARPAGIAARLPGEAARGKVLPDGRNLYRRRRVSVHDPQLGRHDRRGSRTLAGDQGLPCARRGPPEGAGRRSRPKDW